MNHMVHQSHALSSGSHTIFQLPPGAVPTVETQTSNVLRAKPSSTQEASALIKPARLVISNNASDVSQALSWSPAIVTLASATSNSSLLSQVALPSKQFGGNSNLTPTTQVGLPSFLLDDKPDGMVHEGLNQAKQGSANHNQDTSFSCIGKYTSLLELQIEPFTHSMLTANSSSPKKIPKNIKHLLFSFVISLQFELSAIL